MHRRVHAPTPFRVLVGTYPHHTEPDRSPPLQPAHTRTAVLYGPIHKDGYAQIQNGLINTNPVAPFTPYPAVGQFTVADNNFTTGRAILVLGNYRLISNIDFIPGGGAAATALAIAAAIDRLPGFDALAAGINVVVGYYSGSADEIDFRAEHYGTVVNFTPFIPPTGEMFTGSPNIEPPVLT